jgi:putative oxidoreductase
LRAQQFAPWLRSELESSVDAPDFGLLILRLVVGLTMAAHGAQKAFGWWNGPGPAGWTGAMTQMNFRPQAAWAAVSTGAELVGGLMLAVGFVIPLAVGILIAQLIVIIGQVHWSKGFFSMNGGIEFPLALLAAVVAIALTGPGQVSADAALGLVYGLELHLAFIGLGVIAAAIALSVPRMARASDAAESSNRG